MHMTDRTFRDSLREYLRNSGYSQEELADAIGLHPKVLSRKLHGNGNAHLTQFDVKRIITKLAEWYVISTRMKCSACLIWRRWGQSALVQTSGRDLLSVS